MDKNVNVKEDIMTGSEVLSRFSMEDIMQAPRGNVKEYSTPMPDRKGHLKIVMTDNLGIIDGTMVSDKPTAPLTHFNDRPFVEMNFMLEGAISQTYGGLLRDHHYEKGYHNLLFNPYEVESNRLLHCGTNHVFSVHLLPEYMITLFSGYLPQFESFAEKVSKGERFILHSPSNFIDPGLKYFFTTFWNYPEQAGLRKLYFDAKVLDLLCRQCELMIGHVAHQSVMTKADLEKIYAARELMLNRLADPPTLSQLSLQCGLNEFKLKKYFKEVFGMSVLSSVHHERLTRAQQMILQGEKNISAIAYELGYSHAQHFHRAFKKKFGMTPREMLK